jgi:hypothetical protein
MKRPAQVLQRRRRIGPFWFGWYGEWYDGVGMVTGVNLNFANGNQ